MDAKNRFPRGVKCTHLAGPAVSAARAAMGVAMADMCVATETVDGCLSTTDSAAGDGSKTRDESTQQLALPTGLDTILAAIDFYSPRPERSPRVGSFGRMRASIVRRSRTRFSLAISINHRVSNHGRCAAGFRKERNPTRVSTTTRHPGVNHGSVWDFQITNGASRKHPGFPSRVANHHLGPIWEFHGSHGNPNRDCRPIRNPWISSVELTRNGLIGKD